MDSYRVSFINEYFETVDLIIESAGITKNSITRGQISTFELHRGTHLFAVNTTSRLQIMANIHIAGSQTHITVVLNQDGSLGLR